VDPKEGQTTTSSVIEDKTRTCTMKKLLNRTEDKSLNSLKSSLNIMAKIKDKEVVKKKQAMNMKEIIKTIQNLITITMTITITDIRNKLPTE